MKEIQIIRIKNEDLYYLNQIIEWNYSWWGIRDGRKKEEVREYFEHCLNTNYKLPQTFGAFLDGKIVGMYCISMVDDLESRPDIYPWLINVFVDPDYRNQGIGKALLESVDENARKANLQELYL